MTDEQRYWQIMKLCRELDQREFDAFMAGEIDILPCSLDRERKMIAELIEAQREDK
jgi:hypothetical protein